MTSLWTHVWNWNQYINYLKQHLQLKPNETGFMFDCWMQCSIFDCSIMFDCLSVQFPKVWSCSIGQVFGWIQLCSIAEPNGSESNRRLEFDWVQLPNVRLTTPGKNHPYRKVRWQYFFVYLTKNWVLWQILIMSNVKAIISNHNKREFIVNPRALMKRERAAILQQTQHLPHGWKLSRSK